MSWQPMTTAPRDGQRFVAGLWIGHDHTARFEMHIVRADPRGEGLHPDADRGWAWTDYTHWMRLPIPLAASSGPAEAARPQDAAAPAIHRAYGVG